MGSNKTVTDIDRSIYDIRDKENNDYRMRSGLTEEIVLKLSEEKNDPDWMREFRSISPIGDLRFRDLTSTTSRPMSARRAI